MNVRGFTLMEVMIAIFVVTVGAGAGFSLVTRVISFTSDVQSQLIASYLAQEGVEMVRNIRDTNFLEGVSLAQGLGDGHYQAGFLAMQGSDGPAFIRKCPSVGPDDPCALNNFAFLRISEADPAGFYRYPPPPPALPGTLTAFKRDIILKNTTDINGYNVLQVNVDVFWKNGAKKVRTSTILYNWLAP